MAIARKGFVSALFVVVAFALHDARADLMPGQTPCEAPPHLECVRGSRGREVVADDACTSKELARLGLRFYCGMSNNDRLTEYWCRPPRLPRPPTAPRVGATDSEVAAYAERMSAWELERDRALGGIERELTFGSSTESRLRAIGRMGRSSSPTDPEPPSDPMRFDCFALATKLRRCGLETERCAPYWTKFRELSGAEFSEGASDRDTFARAAIEAIDRPQRDASSATDGAAASDVDPLLDAAPSAKGPAISSRSCHCDMTSTGGSSGLPLAFGAFFALMIRRGRGRR